MALRADDPRLSNPDDPQSPGITREWWDAFDAPPGHRAEIIQGDLVLTPSPGAPHAMTATRLMHALEQDLPDELIVVQALEWKLATVGVVAAAPVPDVLVVSQTVTELTTPPVLAAEILSRSDHRRLPNGQTYIEGKRTVYAANGLQHYLEIEGGLSGIVVTRYELHDGTLEIADRATVNQILRSEQPFPYAIAPDRL